MKKTLLLISFITLFSIFAPAQLRVAIAGGYHQSEILEENDRADWNEISSYYLPRKSVHIGFIGDLAFSRNSSLFFQPGILYYGKGREYNQGFDTTSSDIIQLKQSEWLNYIDIPLNLVYKLKLGSKAKFIIGAGPYLSFFYNGKTKQSILDKDTLVESSFTDLPVGEEKGKYSLLDYGINGLAGFEIGRVFLTANYSRGLKDIFRPLEYNASSYRHQVMGATLGIFLGKPVMLTPPDKDGDGVEDKRDECPDIPGSPELKGCPDTDGDGLVDAKDQCPGEKGPLANNGCPYRDADGDGVLDKDDACPDKQGPADNKGCPYPDSDGDNVLDKDDSCPTVAGLERYKGCPVPDRDNDGVNDEADKCPDQPGVKEHDGCPPPVKKELVEKINYAARKLQFRVGSSQLLPSSHAVLDEVVKLMKENPGLNLVIEGHTSADGTREKNMILSQNRAASVKNYLQLKGIDPNRLRSVGYGPDKPLNSGTTEQERIQNRRVELILNTTIKPF